MTLGEKLKQARSDHALTQQAVAQQVTVSRQTISSWETGKSYPDIDSLVALSNLYGLTLDTLIKEDTGMLHYLRKSEIMTRLRPIRQAMLILNSLFVVILIFFLPSRLGGGILIAAVLANLAVLPICKDLRRRSVTCQYGNSGGREAGCRDYWEV